MSEVLFVFWEIFYGFRFGFDPFTLAQKGRERKGNFLFFALGDKNKIKKIERISSLNLY